jgi:phage-related protein
MDWKPMKTLGVGVREIRVRDETGAYRVIYVLDKADAVYVLNAFQKKTQKTPKHELELAARRLKLV